MCLNLLWQDTVYTEWSIIDIPSLSTGSVKTICPYIYCFLVLLLKKSKMQIFIPFCSLEVD